MTNHNIHIFISHAWKYSDHYDTLSDWIFQSKWNVNGIALNFKNYSVPKDDPIHNAPTNKELKDAIFRHIERSHIIVVPTGMYANYSKWIQKEIDGASNYKKPILAVNPRGQLRTSGVVADRATSQVGWTKESVVKEIWKLYNKKFT